VRIRRLPEPPIPAADPFVGLDLQNPVDITYRIL
jgi:hypothetical protein